MSVATSIAPKPEASDHRRPLPLLQGLLPFAKARLGPDIMAGITLAALGIPEVMGYTKIIGTPVITGLYTLLLPVLAFALFGSSRHLVVGADSATAAIAAAGLTALSLVAYTPKYVALTSLVALAAGGMLLLARIFKLGFLADFLSRTVLVGFLSGVGVQVALGELHGILGVETSGHGFLRQMLFTVQQVPHTHWATLSIALGVLGIIVGFERFAPRVPGALLAMIAMTGASAMFHWGDHGVTIVGNVPSGLPRLGLPEVTWSDVSLVLPIAFSCFIVILAQSAATSRAYALQYRDTFNQNADLVGLALANAAAGCSGTFVVNGSPTKTAMLDSAGGRSQCSHIITASVVLLVLLFFTKLLSYLPNPVLAAIVFMIGVKLVDLRGLADIYRKAPREFIVALVTAATVVFVGVEQGIILAVLLSLLQHVRRNYRPPTGVVVQDQVDHWQIKEPAPGLMIEPGMIMYWFGSDLFYANAAFFAQQVRTLVTNSSKPVRWLVIDFSAITSLDFTAGRALMDLHHDLTKAGVVLALSRLQLRPHGQLERLGLLQLIGASRIFDSRHACIHAYRAEVHS